MEQIACVPIHVSYFLCCTRKSKINAAFTLGAKVRYSLGTNVNKLFLKHTHARIRVRFRCPGTRHKRGHRAPVCTRLCNHCKAHVFFFLNYVWQGGNGVTMYTVTYRVLTVWTRHHFGPVRRHWFLVNVDSPWEMKQNVRISRKRLQLLLDRITLGFSLLIPFKDFKCYGEREGGGRGRRLPISSYGGDWRILRGLKFSIPGFFWLVFHLRGEFCIFIDETEEVLGCLGCLFFFLGGGGWFLSPFDHSVTWNLE